MNESLEVIVEMIAIVSFAAMVVNYTIIKQPKILFGTRILKNQVGYPT